MSCSKPLPPFVCDSLYYLNRNQLERFSIVCRHLKNFIERYLHTKRYRVFNQLDIRKGSYALYHNYRRWHPNRDNYNAQQFLVGQQAVNNHDYYYSFAEMRRYLAQTVRIETTWIHLDDHITYNPDHIEEMESIAHLWSDRKISVWKWGSGILADDIQLILNSPTILQCRYLAMENAHFSFKDYKILYNAKRIENNYYDNKTDPNYWPQFLEQPGMKPVVVLRELHSESIDIVIAHLTKAFSSAVSPNAFKIVFAENRKPLTEFQKTNETSGEKLELKRGVPTEYQNEYFVRGYFNYTLERASI